jgi:DNA-binding NtrC family response regulator
MAAKTVLFVDDEEIVLGVGKQMLEKLGFSVLTAKNGVEALDVYKNNQNDIDIIILDMIMPDMGAADTYVELQSINPVIKVLLSSGYGTDHQTRELLSLGCSGFIQKPFSMQSLSEKIEEILSRS